MKMLFRIPLISLINLAIVLVAGAQTTFTLNGLSTFGSRGDGSVQPGDSIGISPLTGNNIQISAQGVAGVSGAFGVQPGDLPGATNGFNMRGITYDPISGNVIFVDTHDGSGGSSTMFPNAAIYILDPNSGQILSQLNTNGMVDSPGSPATSGYTHVCAGASDDGVVYVCDQTLGSAARGFKIYRWPTANTNDPAFSSAPVVAFSNVIGAAFGTSTERLGETMDVRGAGTNTQIIVGTSSFNGTGTNVFLFTTSDGTNFAAHKIGFPGVIKTSVFNDGIAFGPTNTFWAKQVGGPFLYLSYDPVALATGTNQITGTVISSFTASSANDELLNLAGITVDNANHLLAAVEEIGGIAAGGRGKVWLFDIPDPTNHAPAVLASRTYVPNFTKATATMGYVRFGNGRLYANVVNNGLLASTVDSVSLSAPTFTKDLPATTRVAVGQGARLEVFAVVDVTNYQWFTNNTPIPGANTYFLDVPNVTTNMNGIVYKVIAYNAAGSTTSINSTLTVVSSGDFFHPVRLWSVTANGLPLNDTTNFITSVGGSATPNERCIAFNALSNQLLVVRGPAAFGNLKIMVIDADKGTNGYLYTLKTNGMLSTPTLNLAGIGVADDGAVYAASVSGTSGNNDQSFKVYMWSNSGPNTLPIQIFGTNSAGVGNANPAGDLLGSQTYRFGDNLAVHGAGNDTEIVVDSQNSTTFAGILRPVPDGTMTNWTQTGYLLQNVQGSYGSAAYGTAIGRSLQFGPTEPTPFGSFPTFWQKRYLLPNGTPGAPLAGMGYNAGGGVAPLAVGNQGLPIFTNGSVGINFSLKLAAAVNFAGGGVGNNLTAPDMLDLYDVTDLSQAVRLSSQNLPGANAGNTHLANGNAIAQVVFGANQTTGTNYIFAIDANNGIAAYVLAGGVTPPPKVLAQPKNLRIMQGTSGALVVGIDQAATIQWFKGTNPPVSTAVFGTTYNIANATTSAAGDYFVVATNVNGAVTSLVAHVTVGLTNDNFTLTQVWAANPTNSSFPYVSANGGANTPNERCFAYNALSNQLIVVRCPVSSTAFTVSVVNATSGAFLYTLTTNGIIHEGTSEVSGSNPIDLDAVVVADDGAVYIASETPNASGGSLVDQTKMLHIFRWADSGPTTVPTVVYEGDPSLQPPGINQRWGDVMEARGSGTNTELILNSFDGTYGAVLKPTDSSMTIFTNYWFTDSAGGGSIGRSIQFGTNNTVLEKRKGAPLFYSSYDTNTHTSTGLGTVDSSSTLGGVFVDTARNLAVGVDFVGAATTPDAVALYEISDPTAPMLIRRYNFPVNQVANANFICKTVVAGNRVYSLDANNGLMAFDITLPAFFNQPVLNISHSGTNVVLSWSDTQAILQQSGSLAPQAWTDISTAGQLSITNDVSTGTNSFYRLIKRH